MALWARSGLGYLTSEITPAWGMGEPCLPLNRQASLLAGVAAAIAVAAGALTRASGAAPRRVSFDKLELLALLPMQPIAFAQLADRVVGRDARAPYPGGTMAAADGMVYVGAIDPKHWASLFRTVGELDWAADAVVRETAILREARDLIDARLREWARSATRAALVARTQAAHVPTAQVCRAADVIADPQLAARRFFEAGAGAATPRLPWLARAGEPAATPPRDRPRAVCARRPICPSPACACSISPGPGPAPSRPPCSPTSARRSSTSSGSPPAATCAAIRPIATDARGRPTSPAGGAPTSAARSASAST